MSGRRAGRAVRATVATVAAWTLTASLGPVTAAAVPEPPERPVSVLLADLQRLFREADDAADRLRATAAELARHQQEVGTLQARLAEARGELHRSRTVAGSLARDQYRGGDPFAPYLRLLTARDPDRLLTEGQLRDRAARYWVAAIARLSADERSAAVLAGRARAALDAQQTVADRHARERDAVGERLDEVEELLAALTPEQLAALGRLEATAATGSAPAQAPPAGGAPGAPATERTPSAGRATAPPATERTPSAGGAVALRYAVAQIGKPYAWGAEGPDSFDCSGLTSRAWEAAGSTLPRTSQEQWDRLSRVPLDGLRPGDLVVYFPGATHVGLYLGEGLVVHAPRPGAQVKVSPLTANPVLGAVRPDPQAAPLAAYLPPPLPAGARDGSDAGYGALGPAPATS
ncbi:NlpC/P60 family protein [Streptomyces sp. NPDC049906]|uniref:C40 family peptidase n=1 Tax=Streptomyces sp. NPDC049906 TaxID=3155656 RepID=UPI0034399A42